MTRGICIQPPCGQIFESSNLNICERLLDRDNQCSSGRLNRSQKAAVVEGRCASWVTQTSNKANQPTRLTRTTRATSTSTSNPSLSWVSTWERERERIWKTEEQEKYFKWTFGPLSREALLGLLLNLPARDSPLSHARKLIRAEAQVFEFDANVE